MAYELQLNSFQGPLEVLYQLVKKNRIEISEISLASISEQYLEYMEKLKDFNLDVASEFMVIAAELIEIKIRTLLPGDQEQDEDEPSESNLVQRLQEYHYFKKVSLLLQKYEEKGSRYFSRAVDIADIVGEEIEVNLNIDLSELEDAFKDTMIVVSDLDIEDDETNREEEWEQLKIEDINIEDKTSFILEQLSNDSSGLNFSELLIDKYNKLEVVVTFLSILELAKMAKVKIKQDRVVSIWKT